MLQIDQIKVEVSEKDQRKQIYSSVLELLGLVPDDIVKLTITRKSLDARKKTFIHYNYRVQLELSVEEAALVERIGSPHVKLVPQKNELNPAEQVSILSKKLRHRPVIIGTGPAGIYAALTLVKAGIRPILIERGEPIEKRFRTVARLRKYSELNEESNFCFGEGGAGTFSDGKLTCGKNHPLIKHVLQTYVDFGAPEEILYESHPHIGTDLLMGIAIKMRKYLEDQGASFQFSKIFESFSSGGKTANYTLRFSGDEPMATDHLILALGHSARDTYENLHACGLEMKPKPYAMGVRIEHPQEDINAIQFGGSCSIDYAAEYKLTHNTEDRGIWTFCMCPGGHLLPTSAQAGHLAINGMSYHARKSGFANAAVVVGVRTEDFYKGHPLDGMRYQQSFEKLAFQYGGENYHSPAQRLTDFLNKKDTTSQMNSTYMPGIRPARMDKILPEFIADSLRVAMGRYDQKMQGYINDRALVVGLESKTSSPVMFPRNKTLQSMSHPGIYPAGEGAGYAGGIMSAAVDGVRVALSLINRAES